MKDPKKVADGKKARQQGSAFELRVRKDLEEKGWIVDKWGNNVEFGRKIKFQCWDKKGLLTTEEIDIIPLNFEELKKYDEILRKRYFRVEQYEQYDISRIIPAKAKWAGPGRPMMMGAGFPDFIAFTWRDSNATWPIQNLDGSYYLSGINAIIGVEVKMEGILSREEKEKCEWLLENKTFNKILVASKTKVKNKIIVVYQDFEEIRKGMRKLNN